MDLFKIDPGLALWTWIVFGMTFAILWKYAFPQILNNIKTREAAIAKAVNNAAQIEQRLSAMEEEHAKVIKASKAQGNDILRQIREQAETLRKDLIQKAEDEAHTILVEAKIKIEDERAAMIQSIKGEIADFVCQTSEKVIGKSFVSGADRDWINELVETL